MSSFTGILEETRAILDTIGSSMPPSSIERLWDCISWWCTCGNFPMLSHFLEMVFGKLFMEYQKKNPRYLGNHSPFTCSGNANMLFRIRLLRRRYPYVHWLRQRKRQLQRRVQQQRKWWHPQAQLQWLQEQGHQLLLQHLPQQQGEPPHPTEELLILACQVLTALPKNETNMGDLVDGIMHAALTSVPIEKAASYLSTERLNHVSSALEAERSLGDFKAAAETLKKIARERSLQDLCVLSTPEAVKGDAKKVWSLSELPEPLKELFHVPFLALYNKQSQ